MAASDRAAAAAVAPPTEDPAPAAPAATVTAGVHATHAPALPPPVRTDAAGAAHAATAGTDAAAAASTVAAEACDWRHCPVPVGFHFSAHAFINSEYRETHFPKVDGRLVIDHFTIPVVLRASAGFVKGWISRADGAQTQCHVRRALPGEQAHDIIGVLTAYYNDAWITDVKDIGAAVTNLEWEDVEALGWQQLPSWPLPVLPINVFCPATTNDRASPRFPILQSLLDDIISGCLEYSEGFAAAWLETTLYWSRQYLNDRKLARRPWVHVKQYKTIDRLLAKHPDPASGRNVFRFRKLEEEFASEFVATALEAAQSAADGDDDGGGGSADGGGADGAGSSAHTRQAKPMRLKTLAKLISALTVPKAEQAALGDRDATTPRVPERPHIPRIESSPEKPLIALPTDFVFGFGSLINTPSRRSSDPTAAMAIPARVSGDLGYARAWNFQSPTANLTALGVEKCDEGQGCDINGVLYPMLTRGNGFASFDDREQGYSRIEVPRGMVTLLSWRQLPAGDDVRIWMYVPNNPASPNAACSGAIDLSKHPEDMPPGTGLELASRENPIPQSYIDLCILGCLEHGVDFAREFILTTRHWSPFWLNDREVGRRPWIHTPRYREVDDMLRRFLPLHPQQPDDSALLEDRKFAPEFALYWLAESVGGALSEESPDVVLSPASTDHDSVDAFSVDSPAGAAAGRNSGLSVLPPRPSSRSGAGSVGSDSPMATGGRSGSLSGRHGSVGSVGAGRVTPKRHHELRGSAKARRDSGGGDWAA